MSRKWIVRASTVHTLRSQGGGNWACRQFAVPAHSNMGAGVVPMSCYEDGSASSDTPVGMNIDNRLWPTLKIQSGGDPASTQHPSFVMESAPAYPENVDTPQTYGEGFSFTQILNGVDVPTEQQNASWDILRAFSMPNGDRVYYGIVYENQSPTFYSFGIEAGRSVTIQHVNHDGTLTNVSGFTSAGLGIFPEGSVRLQHGQYRMTVDGGQTFHARVWKEVTNPNNGSWMVIPWAETTPGPLTTPKACEELYFTAAEIHGQLAVIYHDVSANKVTVTVDTEKCVGNLTRSISAFEQDGKVAVFFENYKITPPPLVIPPQTGALPDKRALYFKVFDPDTSTFSATQTYQLPVDLEHEGVPRRGYPDWGVHAFDICKDKDGLLVTMSAKLRVRDFNFTSKYENKEIDGLNSRVQPILSDGIINFRIDDFSLDGDHLLESWSPGRYIPPSFYALFGSLLPDRYDEGPSARLEVDYIKAEYDEDSETTFVTTLDYQRRCPFVVGLQGGTWREVGLPMTPSTLWFLKYQNLLNAPPRPIRFGYETANTVRGYDGQVYCSLTNRHDPSNGSLLVMMDLHRFSEHQNHMEMGPVWLGLGPTVNESEWSIRDQWIPVWGSAGTTGGHDVGTVNRVDQHLVVTGGRSTPTGPSTAGLYAAPLVLQNVEFDTNPFEVPDSDAFKPFSRASDAWTVSGNAASDYDSVFYRMIEGTTESKISRTIPSATLDSLNGYRFSARVRHASALASTPRFAWGANPARANAVLQAQVLVTVPAAVAGHPPTQYNVRCRMVLEGGDIYCEIWNGSTWDREHTFHYRSGAPEDTELFILANATTQELGAPRVRLRFVYKIRRDQAGEDGVYDSPLATGGAFQTNVLGLLGSSSTEMSVGLNGGVASNGNALLVYSAGWTLLQPADAVVVVVKDNSSLGIPDEIASFEPMGRKFRPMNDREIMQQMVAHYQPRGFKIRYHGNMDNRTARFHWPSGFRFRVSGTGIKISDRWELSKYKAATENLATAQALHGVWTAPDPQGSEGQEPTIWADATDHGVRTWRDPILILTGGNAQRYQIVYTHDGLPDTPFYLTDPGEVRPIVYSMPEVATNASEWVEVPNAKFLEGTFDRGFSYMLGESEEDPFQPVREIKDAYGSVIETRGTFSASSAEVLSDRFAVRIGTSELRGLGVTWLDSGVDGYVKLHTLDVVNDCDIFDNVAYAFGSGRTVEGEARAESVFPNQMVAVGSNRERAVFDFTFTFIHRFAFDEALAACNNVSIRRKPVWVLSLDDARMNDKEIMARPVAAGHDRIYLCFIDGEPESEILYDESGDEYFTLTLNFRSVE